MNVFIYYILFWAYFLIVELCCLFSMANNNNVIFFGNSDDKNYMCCCISCACLFLFVVKGEKRLFPLYHFPTKNSNYIQALCPTIARQKGTQTIIRLIPNPSASLKHFGRCSNDFDNGQKSDFIQKLSYFSLFKNI